MRALAWFAAAVFVFHHLPAIAGGAGDWIDLLTPFAVAAAAVAVLAPLSHSREILALALLAGLLYVDGHGIHLAANSIRNEGVTGGAEDVAFFWDEQLGHVEWHAGWIALVLTFCLAERGTGPPAHRRGAASLVVLLLGFTLFTSTVEGGDWWLVPPAAVGLAGWYLSRRRPMLGACAGALALAALLMVVWGIWHRGMPEFSDLGWL